jgi:hypothetical protein
MKRKWGWLGHTLRKPIDDITRQALEWNPQGKRSRRRPKNTWRRTVLEEAKGVKKTWAEIKWVAKNRVRWRNLVDALCSAAEWWDYWLIDWSIPVVVFEVWHSALLYENITVSETFSDSIFRTIERRFTVKSKTYSLCVVRRLSNLFKLVTRYSLR